MNFGKVKAVFFILVFILLLAVVVNAALELDAKKHPQVVPTDTEETEVQPTEQPTPEPPPAQQQSSQTMPTVPTPIPADRPAQQQQQQPAPQQQQQPTAPTPPPTEPPMPAGQNLGSGGFSSATGTGLELHCDWSAVSLDNNRAQVTLTISAESYAISLNDMGENVYLRVGDQTASLAQPALQHDGGAINIPFGTKTFTLDLAPGANSFPVAVEWHFRGVYHQVQLDVIECGGTITLNR